MDQSSQPASQPRTLAFAGWEEWQYKRVSGSPVCTFPLHCWSPACSFLPGATLEAKSLASRQQSLLGTCAQPHSNLLIRELHGQLFLWTGFFPGSHSLLGLFTLLRKTTVITCLGPSTASCPLATAAHHLPFTHSQGRMFAARRLPLQSPRPGLQPGH